MTKSFLFLQKLHLNLIWIITDNMIIIPLHIYLASYASLDSYLITIAFHTLSVTVHCYVIQSLLLVYDDFKRFVVQKEKEKVIETFIYDQKINENRQNLNDGYLCPETLRRVSYAEVAQHLSGLDLKTAKLA